MGGEAFSLLGIAFSLPMHHPLRLAPKLQRAAEPKPAAR
jgi:hypothetical protein